MRNLSILVIAAAFLAGCGDDGGGPPATAAPETDAGAEASEPETGADGAASDAPGSDGSPDAPGQDAGPDGAAEAGPDGGGCGTLECLAAAEDKTAQKMAAIAGDDAALGAFLQQVPKGGDLHLHLSGAIYAEDYLSWAKSEGGYCINTGSQSLTYSCGSGTVAVPSPGDALFTTLVKAWSMEGFVASPSESGHDHFFATFGKYGAISGSAHHGKMLANVMARAASENQVYIELMLMSNSTAGDLGADVWSDHHGSATLQASELAVFHGELTASSGMTGAVSALLNDINNSESTARQELECDDMSPAPGCEVATRYVAYISRSGGTTGVFAQLVAAYEAAMQDPRLVGVNLVGPEDGTTALSRYDLHMQMLKYLYESYRLTSKSPLRLTLHAGELAAKYMPGSYDIGTIGHVRKAVEIAHADRIGHGVAVMQESDPTGLLASMKQSNVLVEICLSSNIQILEISGSAHPLAQYISAGVPVALATDDQGVSRSSMAGEYVRAVKDQQLDYHRLKAMARNSLQYSFLPGASLWSSLEPLQADAACAQSIGDVSPPSACAQLLSSSARAAVQWELEKRLRAFEASQ